MKKKIEKGQWNGVQKDWIKQQQMDQGGQDQYADIEIYLDRISEAQNISFESISIEQLKPVTLHIIQKAKSLLHSNRQMKQQIAHIIQRQQQQTSDLQSLQYKCQQLEEEKKALIEEIYDLKQSVEEKENAIVSAENSKHLILQESMNNENQLSVEISHQAQKYELEIEELKREIHDSNSRFSKLYSAIQYQKENVGKLESELKQKQRIIQELRQTNEMLEQKNRQIAEQKSNLQYSKVDKLSCSFQLQKSLVSSENLNMEVESRGQTERMIMKTIEEYQNQVTQFDLGLSDHSSHHSSFVQVGNNLQDELNLNLKNGFSVNKKNQYSKKRQKQNTERKNLLKVPQKVPITQHKIPSSNKNISVKSKNKTSKNPFQLNKNIGSRKSRGISPASSNNLLNIFKDRTQIRKEVENRFEKQITDLQRRNRYLEMKEKERDKEISKLQQKLLEKDDQITQLNGEIQQTKEENKKQLHELDILLSKQKERFKVLKRQTFKKKIDMEKKLHESELDQAQVQEKMRKMKKKIERLEGNYKTAWQLLKKTNKQLESKDKLNSCLKKQIDAIISANNIDTSIASNKIKDQNKKMRYKRFSDMNLKEDRSINADDSQEKQPAIKENDRKGSNSQIFGKRNSHRKKGSKKNSQCNFSLEQQIESQILHKQGEEDYQKSLQLNWDNQQESIGDQKNVDRKQITAIRGNFESLSFLQEQIEDQTKFEQNQRKGFDIKKQELFEQNQFSFPNSNNDSQPNNEGNSENNISGIRPQKDSFFVANITKQMGKILIEDQVDQSFGKNRKFSGNQKELDSILEEQRNLICSKVEKCSIVSNIYHINMQEKSNQNVIKKRNFKIDRSPVQVQIHNKQMKNLKLKLSEIDIKLFPLKCNQRPKTQIQRKNMILKISHNSNNSIQIQGESKKKENLIQNCVSEIINNSLRIKKIQKSNDFNIVIPAKSFYLSIQSKIFDFQNTGRKRKMIISPITYNFVKKQQKSLGLSSCNIQQEIRKMKNPLSIEKSKMQISIHKCKKTLERSFSDLISISSVKRPFVYEQCIRESIIPVKKILAKQKTDFWHVDPQIVKLNKSNSFSMQFQKKKVELSYTKKLYSEDITFFNKEKRLILLSNLYQYNLKPQIKINQECQTEIIQKREFLMQTEVKKMMKTKQNISISVFDKKEEREVAIQVRVSTEENSSSTDQDMHIIKTTIAQQTDPSMEQKAQRFKQNQRFASVFQEESYRKESFEEDYNNSRQNNKRINTNSFNLKLQNLNTNNISTLQGENLKIGEYSSTINTNRSTFSTPRQKISLSHRDKHQSPSKQEENLQLGSARLENEEYCRRVSDVGIGKSKKKRKSSLGITQTSDDGSVQEKMVQINPGLQLTNILSQISEQKDNEGSSPRNKRQKIFIFPTSNNEQLKSTEKERMPQVFQEDEKINQQANKNYQPSQQYNNMSGDFTKKREKFLAKPNYQQHFLWNILKDTADCEDWEFITKNINHKKVPLQKEKMIAFQEFKKKDKINKQHVYVIEAQKIKKGKRLKTDQTCDQSGKERKKQTLILWNKGLYSLETKKKLVATSVTKHSKDANMFILGNCEIIVEGCQLSVARKNKLNYYKGNFDDSVWMFNNICAYGDK